jgi:hypothetical protein
MVDGDQRPRGSEAAFVSAELVTVVASSIKTAGSRRWGRKGVRMNFLRLGASHGHALAYPTEARQIILTPFPAQEWFFR